MAVRRELHITAIFGAIFLVVIGGFTPYSVVRSIDRRYELDADVYLAVSVCYGVATFLPQRVLFTHFPVFP